MQKKGAGRIFSSKDGRANLALVVSSLVLLIVMMFFVDAISVSIVSPSRNFTYNGSRNINVTFNVSTEAGTELLYNCSVWTNQSSAWHEAVTNSSATQSIIRNGSAASGGFSNMNFTYSGDGNFTAAVGCYPKSDGTVVFSANTTFFIDTVPPQINTTTPGTFVDGGFLNITSYQLAAFYVRVIDNSTRNVYVVLDSLPSIVPVGHANESLSRDNMTLNSTIALDQAIYNFSIAGLLNFSSAFTGPGPHSVIFCANDSLGRMTCSGRKDFIVEGGNITQIENGFSTMQQGTGFGFGGLNITYGNGTEVPSDTFFNPIGGGNYTFIFNFSSEAIISIAGANIDENQFGNASNARINSTPTREVNQQLGTGYTGTTAWADISSFIPDNVRYLYGIIQLRGTSFSKRMYCNGTTMSNPQCHAISQCNATAFGIFNSSLAVPSGDGCWLESGIVNDVSLASGYTYIFVPHFSGGIGGSDFSQINVTHNAPLFDDLNTTIASRLVNFTLDDVNSTGLNLTANNSINVTISLAGVQKFLFSYINGASTNLSCTSSDTVSPQNTTSVTCNVTVAFSNGTYVINVTAKDTSNNSNPVNVSTGSITITVDQIPPMFDQYNVTHNATTDFTNPIGVELGLGDGVSTAQGRTIYPRANWTDNLTQPFQAAFQFFNATSGSGAWQTLSTTPSNTRLANQSNWANFSFAIPASRNEFEGRNVSFRIIANDTLGNVNNSASAKNFTIQINDTYAPTISIPNGTVVVNGTNTTVSMPIISWLVAESNRLTRINVSVDASTFGATGVNPCGLVAIYDTAAGPSNVESNRNGTFTVVDNSACRLLNGTHFVNITAVDIWGNAVTLGHTFTIQTGVNPVITLSGLESTGSGTSSANPPMNGSTVTSNTGINFSAIVGANVNLRNLSFTSSCNSTGGNIPANADGVTNNTAVKPFQGSCTGSTANRTITVTATDSAGVSTTNLFQFLQDDMVPSLSVNAPTNGFTTVNNSLPISLSAKDDVSNISMFGYYLDNMPLVTLNSSTFIGTPGTNTTIINSTVFTPGTHTIKFTTADAIGTVTNNTVNSSLITFTVVGNVTFSSINSSIQGYSDAVYGTSMANVTIRIKTDTGYQLVTAANETSANTFEIYFEMNGTTDNVNLSLTEINGSAANWQRINFTPIINDTQAEGFITTNWTNTILRAVTINNSLNEFISNNNSYYGVVILPYNISGNISTAQELWWFPNVGDVATKTNISQCIGGFSRTTTEPCWNYTSGGRTVIQVPHFSIVAAVNDTTAPAVNVTAPVKSVQSVGMFIPNITVSSDAVTCLYHMNSTAIASTANKTMSKSGNICLGSTEKLKTGGDYNITFTVIDATNNINRYVWNFTVSDTTAPNNGIVSSSPSTTSAIVTITGTNETVNTTVAYGTTNTSLGSVAMETDFNETQAVTLSGLTASTTYYYNVTVCDYNGNCKTNVTTFSFTTSAAAATTTTTTSSGSSGGGVAAPTASTTAASASRSWDTLAADSTGTFKISSGGIAFTNIVIAVANTVSNPTVGVSSLTSNPTSSSPSDNVYQYLEITHTNIADGDISKATISFKVPKSWLTANNVAEGDVTLYRYNGGQWNALSTTMTSSDADNVWFEAVTPGFSYYAVGGKAGGSGAFAIIDMIREFYAGTSTLTAFDIIDKIRAFYGG